MIELVPLFLAMLAAWVLLYALIHWVMNNVLYRNDKEVVKAVPYELRSSHEYTMYIRSDDGSVWTREFSASTKENAERYVNRERSSFEVVSWA